METERTPLPLGKPPLIEALATPLWLRLAIALAVVALAVSAYLFRSVLGPRGQAAFGIFCFFGIAAFFSTSLRSVNWRTIAWGFVLQLLLALFIRFDLGSNLQFNLFGSEVSISSRPGYELFEAVGGVIKKLLEFTDSGSQFVFGLLADPETVNKVFPGRGFNFAFKALPTIIFISSFFSVLYYYGVLQFLVRVLARAMMYLLRTSGAETLSVTANIFMGQTEAPLIVKPYVPRMTQSELLTMMVGGMAHISGGVMAVYIGFGADPVAILATSVMAAPCSLYLSKLMLPELGEPETRGKAKTVVETAHANVIDAAAGGASDGMRLALNVAAMLIAFIAFIALFNYLLNAIPMEKLNQFFSWLLGTEVTFPRLSLQRIFSWVFSPVALLMGVEGEDIPKVADLLGTKLVLNEFVAYVNMTQPDAIGYVGKLSPRGHILATYALTGFANFASIGIQIGGIGAMAPTRRPDLARLGFRALLTGFLVTLINASIAGMFLTVN
jgi:CNT family concentrative nucleoside transporter